MSARQLAILTLFVCAFCGGARLLASPPQMAFSPPPPGAPQLTNSTATAGEQPPPQQKTEPTAPQVTSWDSLRRESLPQDVGSPSSQVWRWLLGLAVAIALIKWGLPRLLTGGSKGQVAGWLTRISPPRSEGAITVLDTRFLGAGAIHLVSVRGRVLLIGSTAQQVNFLTDLTEPVDTTTAFERVLAQAEPYKSRFIPDEADETQETLQDFRQRLQQLRTRLS